jgi:WD40 repeat protein
VTFSNWSENNPATLSPIPSAIASIVKGNYVSAFYSDRTMIVWDISNFQSIVKYRSSVSHHSSIMDIDYLPSDISSPLPNGTFVTCSTDSTIRLWNIDQDSTAVNDVRSSVAQQSIFGRELLHIVNIPVDKNEDLESGVKCIKFSPDGGYIVCGDFQGNVRVYDVCTFRTISETSAHDHVVTTIDFTNSSESGDGNLLFATGSRDRHIHLFKIENNNCVCTSTVNEHSGAVTCVRFAHNDGLKLISCGTDKSIKFRSVDSSGNTKLYDNKGIPYGTVYDMDIDKTQKYAITTGQDKRLNIWDIQKKKNVRSYPTGVEADILKVRFDPSGLYTATSSTDKNIRLYDFFSGECHKVFKGHSEVVTGISFSNDAKRLITVSGDGCIFIWRVPVSISRAMQERVVELKATKEKQLIQKQQKPQHEIPSPSNVWNEPLPLPSKPKHEDDQVQSLRDIALRNSVDINNKTLESPVEIGVNSELPSWARPRTADKEADDKRPKSAWSDRQAPFQLPSNINSDSSDVAISDSSVDLPIKTESLPVQNEPSTDFHAMYAEEEDDVVYTDESDIGESDKDSDTEETEANRNVLVYNIDKQENPDDFNIKSIEISDQPKKIETSDELELVEDDDSDSPVISTEQNDDFSDFISKHYQNLDKPVRNNNSLRESVTFKFIQLSKSNEPNENEYSSNHQSDELDELEQSLPGSKFDRPQTPAQLNPSSSIFGRLALIQGKKSDKEPSKRLTKREVDDKLEIHQKRIEETEINQPPATNQQVIVPHLALGAVTNNEQASVVVENSTSEVIREQDSLPDPEQSESTVWSPVPTQTPRLQTSRSISVCKSKIESLSRLFTDTLQSIDEVTRPIEDQSATQEEVHQVNELVNSFQTVLDNMRAKFSQKLHRSTAFTNQESQSMCILSSSTQQVVDVSDILEKYSTLLTDLVAKKLQEDK